MQNIAQLIHHHLSGNNAQALRPLSDEFWNLIDGQRSLAEIGKLVTLQFDFTLEPATFLPFADEMMKAELIEFS